MKPELFFRKTRLKERLEEECFDYVRPIWDRYTKEVRNWHRTFGLEGYSIGKDKISISYWSYDSVEYEEVPIEYFIDFDKAIEEARLEKERLAEIKRAEDEEKARLQQESHEKFERELFEQLKAKFGE